LQPLPVPLHTFFYLHNFLPLSRKAQAISHRWLPQYTYANPPKSYSLEQKTLTQCKPTQREQNKQI